MSQTKAQLLDGKSATIQFTGGSASVPAVSFTGDTNTGIYSPGADQVAISTNSTGRLFVGSDGRIGFGTSSPGGIFHTLTTGADNVNFFERASGAKFGIYNSSANTYIGTFSNHDLRLATNDIERLRITSAGLVGIGTSSPQATLNVYGTDGVVLNSTDSTWKATRIAPINEGSNYKASLAFYTHPDAGGSKTDPTERMRIDSAGRLLVGTSSLTTGTVNIDGSFYLSDANSNFNGLRVYEESAIVAAGGTSSAFFVNTHGGGLCQITVQRTNNYIFQVSALYFVVGKGLGGSPSVSSVVAWTGGQSSITTPTINISTGQFTLTNNDANEVRIFIHYFFNRMDS